MVLSGGYYRVGFDYVYYEDTWEYDGSSWVENITAVPAEFMSRYRHALAYDQVRQHTVMFGGYYAGPDGSIREIYDDTWFLSHRSPVPDETCLPDEDGDGDELFYCEEPDCSGIPFCQTCGDGFCQGNEWCRNCEADCGACTGCSDSDIRLGEIYGGSPVYIEITNTGSCVWDASGLQSDWSVSSMSRD